MAQGFTKGTDGYLNLAHAASYLDIPESTLREYVRLRKLACFKPGRHILFRVRDLDRWMELHRVTAPMI